MSTKICDIVNNLSQLIDQQWYDEFWSKYGPGYKGGREAFKAEALEFCLAKHGHTYRKNYQHDSIFYFDPSLVIDWKWVNPIYNSACVNYHTADYDSTHYGFFRMNLDDVNIGKLLKFQFVSIVDNFDITHTRKLESSNCTNILNLRNVCRINTLHYNFNCEG